jgi:HSP20 family molecular chaperone IbpA
MNSANLPRNPAEIHYVAVSISAETKKAKEEKKGDQVVVREYYVGKQYRAFTLSQAVDDSKTSAKYVNGVLELVLPKKAASDQEDRNRLRGRNRAPPGGPVGE